MNPLTVNPETGFLESTSPNFQTFDSDKKKMMIELALEAATRGEWPDVNAICKQIGIRVQTFYNHKSKDGEFREAWEEVKRTVAGEIAKVMYTHSKRPGNYMDRVTLLRHMYPEEWGGEARVQTFIDFGWLKSSIESVKTKAIDAVVVDNNSTSKPIDTSQ